MKLSKTLGAVVAAGLLACAGQAAASVWVATYKGHVDGGYDTTGVFGTAGSYLDELEFVATFTYDTAIGSLTTGATSEIGVDTLIGATISIGGSAAFDFGSGFGNNIQTHSLSPYGPDGPGYVFHSLTAVFDIPGFFHVDNSLTLDGGAAAAAFLGQAVAETPVVHAFGGSSTAYSGYFQINESSFLFPPNEAYGYLRPETYSVSAAAAAPEPETWALMILGFGGTGVVLRRRRSAFA